MNLSQYDDCICKKYNNTLDECKSQYMIGEQGKFVKLEPKSNEKVVVMIIDGCIISDNDTKCDALFLYEKPTKKYSFLVELKGASEIEKAFKQLSYTKYNRDEYKIILNIFDNNKNIIERFAIVSNGVIEKTRLTELEDIHGIRVRQILHSEATTPVPDLRKLI